MIGDNIRKEVLKRENRYKFYDENNKCWVNFSLIKKSMIT